jgi:hypothetical protein
MPDLNIPTRVPTTDESLADLKLVLERTMYVVRWIADTPQHLIDGQHHQVLRDAISALTRRLGEGISYAGFWSGNPKPDADGASGSPPGAASATQPDPIALLVQHGLTGAEWALKFEAFDRHFRAFLDRTALLQRREENLTLRYEGLDSRLSQLEAAEFFTKLRGNAMGSLGIGATIAESAADALSEIPGAKGLLGSLREAAGALAALLKD